MSVRLEKVVLDLEDKFTSPMMRAAAATKTLDKSLGDLDGTTVRTDRDMDRLSSGSLSKAAVQSRTLNREIDRTSGRLRLLAETALVLGPALIPIGAVALPAITGLAAQAGAAALAGGTMIVAFQGVGDALKAVNKAALEPTAANLEAAQIAMQGLAPETREFVRQIQEMQPAFTALRDAAAAGLFPGLSDSLDEMQTAFPQVERVLYAIGDAAGDLAENFAEGLAGPRGQEFLRFVEAEVPRALTDLGRIVGNLAAGAGEMWMAFTPLNNDFSDWMLDASRSFDDWAQGLSQSQGFQDFVAYIRESGPQVADAMGSIGNALLQVVQAAAPLGGPVLSALKAVADVIAAIASSNAGPAIMTTVAALTALNRGMAAFAAIKASSLLTGLGGAATGTTAKMTGMQRAASGAVAALAGLAVVDALQGGLKSFDIGVQSMTTSLLDLNDGIAATQSANLDDLANSIDRLANPSGAESLQDTLSGTLGGIWNEEEHDRAVAQIEALDAALAGLASSGQADVAAQALEGLDLTASQTEDLISLLPQYSDALAGAENQARLTGKAGAKGGAEAASGFRRAASAAQQFRSAVEAANRALEGRASVRDYEQAIDDLRKSLKENGRTLNVNTQRGRDNQAALDAIASSAVKVAEGLRGTNRVQFLQAARRDMIDAAMKLDMNRDKARALADRLLGLDKIDPNVMVTVDSDSARNEITQVKELVDSIDTYVPVTIAVSTAQLDRARAGTGMGLADGGMVPGPRYPYRDKVLAMLAPGEEVITNRNGEADRFRADRAAGRIPRYAEGGTVGGPVSVSQHVSFAPATVDIRTPWGMQQVELVARAVARSEIDAEQGYRDTLGRQGVR